MRIAITKNRLRILLLTLLSFLLLSPFVIRKQQATSVVTITEFSDFQCPYCKHAAGVVEQLRQNYDDNVKFVFKQMPLPMHQHAFKAAQASVCAREQGRFWEYHDRLFAASDLSGEALNRIAAEVGLNRDQFSQCLESPTSRAIVEKDMAEAERLSVSGTPTFFIDGKAVGGAATFAALNQEIDSAMTKRNHPLLGSTNTGDALFVENTASPLSTRPQVSVSQSSTAQVSSVTPGSLLKDQQTSSTTTSSGVTLSPASINFGYQLVGTTGSEVTETVTNSRTAPLVITEISVTGRDRRNFIPAYSFTLPVTVAPGNSIAINLSFTPSLPWRSGTRNARLVISEKKDSGRSGTRNDRETSEEKDEAKDEAKDSQSVPLTGIGATCGGPLPGCSSGCADTDGDGLNDAWEFAGGIDLNNDGVIDATNDVPLPGADPNRPDIYLQYDYMGWGTPGAACVQDSDCTAGGATPNYVCHESRCNHNHKPDPQSLQIVVDSFARHGVALHIDPNPHEVPHSEVITFSRPGDGTTGATAACAGADIQAGVLGGQAVSFHDIKASYFDPKRQPAYHYTVFSHFATCLSDDPFGTIGNCSKCPRDRATPSGQPTSGTSGTSELPGNDFIVSLGARYFAANIKRRTLDEAGVFMHELGHNLGLHHDGDNADHELAPNYLSVMNNKYVFSGIQEADAVGSTIQKTCTNTADCQPGNVCFLFPDIPNGSCRRVDYSSSKLNTLTESGLDETAGVSPLSSGLRDIVRFFTFNGANGRGPAAGAIDWDGFPPQACTAGADCVGGGALTGKCLASGACEVRADLNKDQVIDTFVGYNDWDHGSCSSGADCPVNGIRLTYHVTVDPAVDPHEPCVQNKCQTLWYAFQCTNWGKKD